MINANLLIVDQDKKAADGLGEKLQSIGYHISGVALNQEEAEKLIAAKPVDVVIVHAGHQEVAQLKGDEHIFGGSITVPIIFLKVSEELAAHNFTKTGAAGLVDSSGGVEALNQLIQLKLQNHNLELNLEESEARYRDLYENPTNLNLTIDTTGQILNCNQHTKEVLAYSCDKEKPLSTRDSN